MKLHQLSSIQKKAQRIGRGGKRGSYSGRGVKGQKSRSGRRIRPAERDLIIRLPKLRGFRNKPKSDTSEVFNLGAISSLLSSGADKEVVITREFFKKAKLLSKNFNGTVKILATGEILFPISVKKDVSVSESARKKIEKAGGKVEL